MKKQIVHENTGMVLLTETIYQETLTQLNQIFEDYKKFTGFSPLTTEKFKNLFHHTDAFVKQQAAELVGEIPSFGGFKMKMEAFLETLELPDTTAIKSKIQNLKAYWQKNNTHPLILDSFEVKEGAVFIIEEKFSAALDNYRIYAVNEKEQKALKAFQTALQAYKELDNIVREYCEGSGGLQNFKPEIYFKRDHDANLVINEQFYLTVINNGS